MRSLRDFRIFPGWIEGQRHLGRSVGEQEDQKKGVSISEGVVDQVRSAMIRYNQS